MNSLAPIALFCFKRKDTLIRCIDSLKNCPEYSDTDLIIFSDCHRNEEEKQRVDEVRAYCNKIKGFKSVQINIREQNLGVDCNIIQGIQEMAEQFENFIVVEDDLEVANQFLHFMNAGLRHFKNFETVLTVSAFNYVKIPQDYTYDCYFAQRTNPWGWATWSHKIKEVDWDLAITNNFLVNSSKKKSFNKWGSDRSRMLRRTLEGEIRAWDIRLDYFQFEKKFTTVYSTYNLVINLGFNDPILSSNTDGFNRFKTPLNNIVLRNFRFPENIIYNNLITKKFISRNSLIQRIFTQIMKKLRIYNP